MFNKILPTGGAPRHGPNMNWTGNDNDVLELLFEDSYTDDMSNEAMNLLVEDYAGSTRFQDRLKNFKVQRWTSGKNKSVFGSVGGRIPFDGLLIDWMEIGLITEKIVNDSLVIKKYEDAIEKDATIKQAKLEMAAGLCVEMSIEDAIFNGLSTKESEK
mgnify:FL=1|jgi:hypothetical protein|tara:strand:+ start:991 stop:1464 length:474 start_codon:yes stop_codon:yes gene_type:complete